MSKNYFILLFSLLFISENVFSSEPKSCEFKMAILGLGSRSQFVLLDCLKFNKNIQVVAVCDDHAVDSFTFFVNTLKKRKNPLLNDYKNIFNVVSIYPDNEEGLKELFKNHTDIDMVFLTSANYKHLRHLQAIQNYCSCKKIYMEKPLFRSLDEFTNFQLESDADILIGLTLRYSSMSRIVVKRLLEFKNQLGTLQRVQASECVRFYQGLTSFMMSWRRHISLSGGLLLEKCIHDLDLALFFIHALGINPQEITIKTETFHNFFNKSNKNNILNEILHNDTLKPTLIDRHFSHFQRFIPFFFDQHGNIDWSIILDAIFQDLPDDDNFDNVDIIPDSHRLYSTIKTLNSNVIDLDLEVDLGGFRPKTERGMNFVFEYGNVAIDVMQSSMKISLHDGTVHEFDLQTNNSDHADGDEYIARAILGIPVKNQYIATFDDPIVQLANMMALVSEKQSLLKDKKEWSLRKSTNNWVVAIT